MCHLSSSTAAKQPDQAERLEAHSTGLTAHYVQHFLGQLLLLLYALQLLLEATGTEAGAEAAEI